MKLLVILLFLFSACTTPIEDYRRRNVDEYFVSSGIVQYFLPDLPAWADTVPSAGCRREGNARFFDLEKLKSSFNLSYTQVLQMQLAFNIDRFKSYGKETVALTEEERLFYAVSERVQGNILPFNAPKYKQVSLVVVDDILATNNIKLFNKIINDKVVASGFPVFVSLCFRDSSVRKFLSEAKFESIYEVIPASFFSPFDKDGGKTIAPQIDLSQFFTNQQRITLFHSKEFPLYEIKGVTKRQVIKE